MPQKWELTPSFQSSISTVCQRPTSWTTTSLYPTYTTNSLCCKTPAIYVRVRSAGCSRVPRQWRFFPTVWYNYCYRSWACCGCRNMDHDVSHGTGSNFTFWNATQSRERWRSHMCRLCKDPDLFVCVLRSNHALMYGLSFTLNSRY